jgi:hypothetical protein
VLNIAISIGFPYKIDSAGTVETELKISQRIVSCNCEVQIEFKGVKKFEFISSWFNDAVNSSNYIALNDRNN